MTETATQIYTVGGTVQAGQGLYLPRAVDDELLALCRAGAFAYILAPRQSGKSSLMIHTAERLAAEGGRGATVDLTRIGTQVDAEQWYFGFLYEIRRQLRLRTPLAPWWQAHADLGLTQRLTLFFEEVVLGEIAKPVVIFVDEIDTTLNLTFTDDFYAAIRALYVARAEKPTFARLSFVLIGVATPGDLIRDPKRTPFNIGHRVELPDFTAAEAQPLAAGLGLPATEAAQVLGWVLDWTGGHPYLTQRLCQALTHAAPPIWTATEVARVVHATFLGEQSDRDNNLQFVRDMLTKRAPDPGGVLTTYQAILRGRPVINDEQSLVQAHLKLSGAVRVVGHHLQVRNRLYCTVFGARWVKEHLPATPWRLIMANPLVRFGLAAALIYALSVTILGGWALDRAGAAEHQSRINRAQTLVAQTMGQDRNPELGILLAMEAISTTRRVGEPVLPEAVAALHLAIAHSQMRLTLRGHTDSVNYAAFSPDGLFIATASSDHTARVWDARTGQLLRTLAGHTDAVWSANYSRDGRKIVTASDDKSAKVWDAATGRVLLTIGGSDEDNAGNYAVFSADGQRILTASGLRAGVWDANSGRRLLTLSGHTDWLSSAAYSPDERLIITASGGDGTAKIWDAATGKERLTLEGHKEGVISAVFSPDGKSVLTASNDGTAKIWDAATGKEHLTLKGHTNNVLRANYSPDGQTIVTASADATVILWDATTGEPRRTIRGHEDVIFSAAFSPDGRLVLTASQDKTARVWDLALSQERPVLLGPKDGLLTLTYSPDDRHLATASQDGTATVWDATTGQKLFTLQGHTARVTGIVYSPDGRRIATASSDKTARVWDATTGQVLLTLQGHTDGVSGISWSPDGQSLATASNDGTAKVWSAATGQVRLTLKGHTGIVFSSAWSPDGQALVTAGNDHLLKIWEATSGRPLRTIPGHTDWVSWAAYSPDGRWIVSASNDKTARIWNAATGQEKVSLQGHAGLVNSAVFSPDGGQVVTASDDGTAKIWDTARGVLQANLVGHEGGVAAAVYSRDGRYIATAGADGTVRQYYTHLEDLLALANTRVSRGLSEVERQTYLGEALPTPTPAPTLTAGP